MYLRILFFLFLFCFSISGYAQILDDSTRLIYGPNTTKYVLEEDVLNDNKNLRLIDTSIYNFHNYHFLLYERSTYQNLGNLGTPTSQIYYKPPARIGKNLGFNSFDIYAFHPDQVRYYDTKSPYTSLYYVQSIRGQQILDAEFSRNIRPNWNFGFDLVNMASNKTIGVVSRRDKQVNHFSFAAFTRYFTKNERYQLLVNFSVLDHKNFETGGVKQDSGETKFDLFDYRVENINLSNARSMEKRSSSHVYQQLSLTGDKRLQLFHIFDYYTQSNRFDDFGAKDSVFYPGETYFLTGAGNGERIDYNLFENKGGVKGRAGNLSYNVYYRSKYFGYKQNYEDTFSLRKAHEDFIGGNTLYQFKDSISTLNFAGEYYFGKSYATQSGKDYFLKADYKNKYFSGGYYLINHSPTLVQLDYLGNRFAWSNDDKFVNTTSHNSYLSGNISWKIFTFNPGVGYSNVKNYIYYDTLAKPAQFNKAIDIFSLDMMLKIDWKSIHLHNFTKYTSVSSPEIIRVPEIFNHSRIYFEGKVFKNALFTQIGFDLYWKSDYYANNYMPVTQQFYLNNDFLVNGYLLADIFMNVQIKKTLGFIKFSHVNMGLAKDGYFITPYYPGMPRTFEFGLKWMFFD